MAEEDKTVRMVTNLDREAVEGKATARPVADPVGRGSADPWGPLRHDEGQPA